MNLWAALEQHAPAVWSRLERHGYRRLRVLVDDLAFIGALEVSGPGDLVLVAIAGRRHHAEAAHVEVFGVRVAGSSSDEGAYRVCVLQRDPPG